MGSGKWELCEILKDICNVRGEREENM